MRSVALILSIILFYSTGWGQGENVFKLPYEILEELSFDSTFIPVNDFVVLDDFNGDGFGDLLYAAEISQLKDIVIEWNDGSDHFTVDTIHRDSSLHNLLPADLDSDNDIDLVFGSAAGIFHMVNSGGSFSNPVQFLDGYLLVNLDFNKDGLDDFIYTRDDKLFIASSIQPLTYMEEQIDELAMGYELEANLITTGDLNGDNLTDVVYVNDQRQSVMLLNDGNGIFQQPVTADIPLILNEHDCWYAERQYLKIVDADKNGTTELIVIVEFSDLCNCNLSYVGEAYNLTVDQQWEYAYSIPFEPNRIGYDFKWVEKPDGYIMYYRNSDFRTFYGAINYYDFRDHKIKWLLSGWNTNLAFGKLHQEEEDVLICDRATFDYYNTSRKRIVIRENSNDEYTLLHHHNTLKYLISDEQIDPPVFIADLDGDRFKDLATIEYKHHYYPVVGESLRELVAYRNDQLGGFTRQLIQVDGLDEGAILSSYNLGFKDLDNDGKAELIFFNEVMNLEIYEQSSPYTFQLSKTISHGNVMLEWSTADVNMDGYEDLLLDTTLYLNDGSGGFAFHPMFVLPRTTDINHDGYPDFYKLNPDNRILAILTNNGDMSTSVQFLSTIRWYSADYEIDDMNGDGLADLLGFRTPFYGGGYCIDYVDDDFNVEYQTDSGTLERQLVEYLYIQDAPPFITRRSFLNVEFADGEKALILFHLTEFGLTRLMNTDPVEYNWDFISGDFLMELLPLDLADMDNDGDLDLVTFNRSSVGYLENSRLNAPPQTTSVTEILNIPEFSIWPNPGQTNGFVRIENGRTGMQIELHTTDGKLIHTAKLAANQIRLPTLSPGIYIATLKENGRITGVSKLVTY